MRTAYKFNVVGKFSSTLAVAQYIIYSILRSIRYFPSSRNQKYPIHFLDQFAEWVSLLSSADGSPVVSDDSFRFSRHTSDMTKTFDLRFESNGRAYMQAVVKDEERNLKGNKVTCF